MAFDPEYTEQLRENCNFEELVEAHCQGIKRLNGNKLVALCPFHHEKTPSFHIDLNLKRYYCFGCKEKGDVFSFVMATEHLDFPDTLRFLASRCGMPEPEMHKADPAAAARMKAKKNAQERLYEINEFFAGFFRSNLKNNPSSPVARYFYTRNIPEEYAEKFRIGAAPDSWDTALTLGRQKGYSDKELAESGIVLYNEEKNRFYDRFRSRLVFPIWDTAGRVVGFSARTIEKDHAGAKYVNTPETPIFHKGSLLYAFPHALKGFREQQTAILCEGQLDTIAFFRSGLPFAVAPQGTGFTAEQAKLLSKHVSRICLAFDSDQAGMKAVMAALEHLLPLDIEVIALDLSGGKDPDEILKSEGPAGLPTRLEHAISLDEIIFRHLSNNVDLSTPFGMDTAVKTCEHYFSMLSSQVVKARYWEQAAQKLSLPPEILYSELRRLKARQAHKQYVQNNYADERERFTHRRSAVKTVQSPVSRGACAALESLLELALIDADCARLAATEAPSALLGMTNTGKALNFIAALTLNDEWQELQKHIGDMPAEAANDETVARILAAETTCPPEKRTLVCEECLARLNEEAVKLRRQELLQKLKAAAGTPEEQEIFKELSNLQ